jgi:hypothetical protein
MDAGQLAQHVVGGLAHQEAERRVHELTREQVRNLVRQTVKCDGSSTASVRAWIREVSLAFNQVGQNQIIEIVSQTVTGPFRFELERYIEGQIAANNVAREVIPWDQLRDHLSHQFLNTDEAAALRDELERVKQSSYEPDAQYSRRFREVADAAYPVAQRNADQERILIRAYARGLKSDTLARKLVERANPGTLEAAITAVAQYSERRDAYSRLGRTEEPMEVGPIDAGKPSSRMDGDTALLQQILKYQEQLNTKVAKLEAEQRQTRAAKNRPSRPGMQARDNRTQTGPSWDKDGRPRCFECGKFGHFGRDCRQRQNRNPHSGNE